MTATDPWVKLREPFLDDELELLPKPYKKDSPKGHCDVCGGYHGLPAMHLTYVGHAGITTRLNDVCGPDGWSWEPMGFTEQGTPAMSDGGMWIRLTIMGHTKPAFGDAQDKTGPNATKEIIGDAIRNGAMRFGVGTYLWSKSDRAAAEAERNQPEDEPSTPKQRALILDAAGAAGYDRAEATAKVCAAFGLDSFTALTYAQAEKALAKPWSAKGEAA